MFKKVFIHSEPQYEAGGLESVYQTIDAINQQGGDAVAVFRKKVEGDPIPQRYKKYNIKWTYDIEYSKDNLLIIPEVWTDQVYVPGEIRKAIWWLSVDNNSGAFKDFDLDLIHFYQSSYAHDFLNKKGAKYSLPLHDYIYNLNDVDAPKKDIVCFNPVKGLEYTRKIVQKLPHVKFVPIQGMTHEQVYETLSSSKVYIDFGNHPGKDRIPRESALRKNIIITNQKGSANHFSDVAIPYSYKRDVEDLDGTCDLIEKSLAEYDTRINHFSLYRQVIRNQKTEVFNQAKQYFL